MLTGYRWIQTRFGLGNGVEPQGLETVSVGKGLLASNWLAPAREPSNSVEVDKWKDVHTFVCETELSKDILKKKVEELLGIPLTHRKSYLRRGDWYIYYFSCAEVKRCGCKFLVRALCPSLRIQVQTYGSHNEHEQRGGLRGVSAECRAALVGQILARTPPALAHQSLCLKYKCTFRQVRSFYCNYAASIKRASWTDTIRAWTAWCNERTFVAGRTRDHTVCVLHKKITEEDFIIVLSTPALLYTRVEQMLHQTAFKMADATYKVTWEGLPLLVMGTCDWKRAFLPTAYALAMHEREEEYGQFETAVSKAVLDLARHRGADVVVLDALTKPRLLCSDAASAIPLGEKFAHPTHDDNLCNTCYSHMIRKVRQNGSTYITNVTEAKRKRELLDELVKDLQNMRWIVSCRQFELAVDLFHKKWWWHHKQREVIAWLFVKGGWLDKKRRWARCHVPVGLPSSTNALERHNRTIKDLLRRKRDPGHRAISNLADGVVAHWSSQMLPRPPLSAGPDVSQKLWDETQWYIKGQEECSDLFGYEVGGYITFPSKKVLDCLRASATGAAVDKREVESKMVSEGHRLAEQFANVWARTDSWVYRGSPDNDDNVVLDPNGNPLTLDSLIAWLGSFYVLTPLTTQRPGCPSRFDCSCPDGSKFGVCKHSLSLTVRRGLDVIPNDLRHGVVGQRRGAGRPKRTSPALVRQPDVHLLFASA